MLNNQVSTKRFNFSFLIFNFLFLILLASCSVQQQIAKSAKADVLDAKALQTAHVGISIFDPSTNKYLYNYQGDKYFVPASNIKLPTCYAAMKYLGDSLVGARLTMDEQGRALIFPAGDPTFLNLEFKYQPLFEKIKNVKGVYLYTDSWKDDRWGSGWS